MENKTFWVVGFGDQSTSLRYDTEAEAKASAIDIAARSGKQVFVFKAIFSVSCKIKDIDDKDIIPTKESSIETK